MNNKKKLGQFYTTNYEYILQKMNIPKNTKIIIEPFTGNGDLLKFINKYKNNYIVECFDIDPKHEYIIRKDTLLDPPTYNNKYVITNPPYLARNKATTKMIYDKYNVNDLYKCFIKTIINDPCDGGIIIIPLNFLSSIRKSDIKLREEFLNKYTIKLINIFEEKTFEDTSYTICSIQFIKKINENNKININIYPSNKKIRTYLTKNNNYLIGGDIYYLTCSNTYNITRLTNKNKNKNHTNILVKCIDDNENNKIRMSYVDNKDIYIDDTPNQSARTYATLIIEPNIDKNKQKTLVKMFNNYLNKKRNKYNSLFLTNYRESKDIARKRISFELVYLITKYLLDNLN